MGADSFQQCFAFLLGGSVGYAIRAAISNIRRANVRRQRRRELARYAPEHSALDRQMVAQEQASSQPLAGSPVLTGEAARAIESEIEIS